MYMSYCRFEGTLMELKACMDTVEEHTNEEAVYEVSENEVGKFREMVELFHGWMQDMGLVTYDGELDEQELDRVCDMMRQSFETDDECYPYC